MSDSGRAYAGTDLDTADVDVQRLGLELINREIAGLEATLRAARFDTRINQLYIRYVLQNTPSQADTGPSQSGASTPALESALVEGGPVVWGMMQGFRAHIDAATRLIAATRAQLASAKAIRADLQSLPDDDDDPSGPRSAGSAGAG